MHFSHTNRDTGGMLPLWLGFFLIAAVPFLSILRLGPLPSFFLESMSLASALIFVLLSALKGCLKTRPSAAFCYFLALAAFWFAQSRLMALIYPGMNDMVSWTFVILALTVWACRGWVVRFGQENCVAVLAWVLLLTTCVQGVIAWLQYSGAAAHFHGLLMYRPGIVEGQLAQRNHLGHYLMWGVLATAFLWSQRRLSVWIALPVLCYLAATMGLTGSRTIFGYVLALALLLPLWRIFSGSPANRIAGCMATAALFVLLWQFALEPLLALFRDGNMVSAAERLGNSFGQSGRNYEWHKAWQAFLSAPWFGHGWGSYPLQSFLIDNVYPNGFRPYETGVLFTHSHNSLLNLLAEMGLAGTILVLAGLLFAVKGCLKKNGTPASLFLLAAMSVSLVHSFLEYPLWYIYFLSAFALFVGLAPSSHPTEHQTAVFSGSRILRLQNLAAAWAALLILAGLIRLIFVYQELRVFSGSSQDPVIEAKHINGLLRISRNEPMFAYYADFALVSAHLPLSGSSIPAWAVSVTRNTTHYRPFSFSYKWGIVAYREGLKDEAQKWLDKTYRYYPNKMPFYARTINSSPYLTGLHAQISSLCKQYYAGIQQENGCTE